MSHGWSLHPQLIEDCHRLGRLRRCHLLLHRNAAVRWFILVPETEVSDLLDLPAALRTEVLDDASDVSRYLKEELGYPKVNFAALGNVVPQLHLHVIGRRDTDACWPSPVWGHLLETASYRADEVEAFRAALC